MSGLQKALDMMDKNRMNGLFICEGPLELLDGMSDEERKIFFDMYPATWVPKDKLIPMVALVELSLFI